MGWGVTIASVDSVDYYEETVHNIYEQYSIRTPYEFDRWVSPEVRKETIKIKGDQDREVEVWESPKGPFIISPKKEIAKLQFLAPKYTPENAWISMSWTGFREDCNWMDSFFNMYECKDIECFRQNASNSDGIGLNIAMGDNQGNIAYSLMGTVPKRPNKLIGGRLT